MSLVRECPPVVLTRSREDNAELARRLAAAGRAVVEWPATTSRVLSPPGGVEGLLGALEGADWVVFTTRRGVGALAALLGSPEAVRDALAGRRLAAVGPSTATTLADLGLAVEIVGDGSGSAALATLLESSVGLDEAVALVRSDAADDTLPRALAGAGRRVSADLRLHGPGDLESFATPPRAIAAVVCASPSAARRVLEENPWVARVPFVAIGPTTERVLREELEVRDVTVASAPDPEALLAAVWSVLTRNEVDRAGLDPNEPDCLEPGRTTS